MPLRKSSDDPRSPSSIAPAGHPVAQSHLKLISASRHDSTPRELIDTLVTVAHVVQRAQYARFARREISGPRMRLVADLAEQGDSRMGEAAARLGLVPRTITAVVRQLESSGWLARSPDLGDPRATRIELTSAGRRGAQRIESTLHEFAEEAVQNLSAAERRALLRLLRKLQ
jgi:DNA-binding MarR family transcriptional regulator